jgi:hypothetical protein
MVLSLLFRAGWMFKGGQGVSKLFHWYFKHSDADTSENLTGRLLGNTITDSSHSKETAELVYT